MEIAHLEGPSTQGISHLLMNSNHFQPLRYKMGQEGLHAYLGALPRGGGGGAHGTDLYHVGTSIYEFQSETLFRASGDGGPLTGRFLPPMGAAGGTGGGPGGVRLERNPITLVPCQQLIDNSVVEEEEVEVVEGFMKESVGFCTSLCHVN
eukprot:jgi/Botrbrau1/13462/Bobra.0082s0063.1